MGITDAHSHLWISPLEGNGEKAPVLNQEELILEDLAAYKSAGGLSQIDCQPGGAGRDGNRLRSLSRVSGVNVVSCTGFHLSDYYPEGADLCKMETNQAAAYIVCESGVRKAISPEGRRLDDIHLLNDIVRSYRGKADIFRASNDVWEIQKPFYPGITALVVFPRYSPADILHTVRNGDKVPSGITRHLIPHRALNINIPLDVLGADWDLDRKREWLDDWLMERMAANTIRYYAESTFSFDE